MPGENHRVPIGRAACALLLPVLLLQAAPAAAAQVRAELQVSATVVAACLVSTAAPTSDPGTAESLATMSCSDGRGAAVSVEQRPAAPASTPGAGGAAVGPAGNPAPPLTVITISY